MRVSATRLSGPLLFVPTAHQDERGFFARTFDACVAREAGLVPELFVQDNQSRSLQGVVRGLHGRLGDGEAKLVRVANGRVFDVVVDARPMSATFGEVETFVLDDQSLNVLFVPRGFLHGHLTLSATADVCYRMDREHDAAEDVGVHYLDPDLAVAWPRAATLVSEKDHQAGSWRALVARLSS